jgi:hypothetical protein
METSNNNHKATAMLKGLLLETLTVGIDRTSLPNNSFDFEDGVRDGIGLWNAALGEPVFKLAPSSVTADVVVRFVSKVKNENHAQGLVQAQRHFYWKGGESGAKLTATIQIRDNVGRRYMKDTEVARVMGHELGHLLGLADISDGSGLMGEFIAGRGVDRPSDEELEAVTEFRNMVRTALKGK